jgi:hypothetical protein
MRAEVRITVIVPAGARDDVSDNLVTLPALLWCSRTSSVCRHPNALARQAQHARTNPATVSAVKQAVYRAAVSGPGRLPSASRS